MTEPVSSATRGFDNGLARVLLALMLGLICVAANAADDSNEEKITLNLQNKDITALINTVAEVTGRNFVVDPRVKAKVTVVSKRPMAANELYRVFLSILQVHGFSAIDSGEVTKIVPDINAKQLGTTGGGDEGGDEVITRVVDVENVPVAQLVPILRPLIPQQGHFAAYPPTNVLIISDRAANVRRLTSIIQRIDTQSNSQMEVVRLENASATETVRILENLRQNDNQQQQAAPPVQMAADERTNSIILSGEEGARLRLRTLITHLDTPLESSGDTQVVYLRYARAEDLAEVLRGVGENIKAQQDKAEGQTAATSSGDDDEVNIQADEATNSLVISAPQTVQRELQSVINQLDVRRAQVLIEAAIAEVSADTAAELGVQWAVDGTGDGNGLGGTNFDAAGNGSLANIITAVSNESPVNPGSGLSLALGDLAGGTRFAALLRALASDTNTNILSTPSLTTLDNEEAEIRVAENVPFVTGEFTNAGGGNTGAGGSVNPFQTIQREDVGLILKVTPQINEGNSVLLDLEQEVSSVSQSTQAVDLITNKRTIKTSVLVDDGKLVILGGLIDEQTRENEQKVPLLGDIPLIGQLFRYRSSESSKRNLMVFLRPHIVRDAKTMTRYASRKYNYIRAEQIAKREEGVSLLPNDRAPVLPPLEGPKLPPPFGPLN